MMILGCSVTHPKPQLERITADSRFPSLRYAELWEKFILGACRTGQGFSLKADTPSSPAVPWGALREPPLRSKAPPVLPCWGTRHAWQSQAALIFGRGRACFPSLVQTPEVPRLRDLSGAITEHSCSSRPAGRQTHAGSGSSHRLKGMAPWSSHRG